MRNHSFPESVQHERTRSSDGCLFAMAWSAGVGDDSKSHGETLTTWSGNDHGNAVWMKGVAVRRGSTVVNAFTGDGHGKKKRLPLVQTRSNVETQSTATVQASRYENDPATNLVHLLLGLTTSIWMFSTQYPCRILTMKQAIQCRCTICRSYLSRSTRSCANMSSIAS